MSFFDRFRAPKDPTREFPAQHRAPLIWDPSAETLNGIPFGAPAEELRRLGRADDFETSTLTKSITLTYGKIGLTLELEPVADEFHLGYIGVLIGEDPEVTFPCPIRHTTLTLQPGNHHITGDTSQQELHHIFGTAPYRRDHDDQEEIDFWEIDGIEYECEFIPGGHLKRANIYPEI